MPWSKIDYNYKDENCVCDGITLCDLNKSWFFFDFLKDVLREYLIMHVYEYNDFINVILNKEGLHLIHTLIYGPKALLASTL